MEPPPSGKSGSPTAPPSAAAGRGIERTVPWWAPRERAAPVASLAGAEWEEPEAEVLRIYGPNWMKDNDVFVSDATNCPGLRAGVWVCRRCSVELAGYSTVLSHFKGQRHQSNMQHKQWQVMRDQVEQRTVAPVAECASRAAIAAS